MTTDTGQSKQAREEFGRILRAHRRGRLLNQTEFGQLAGVTPRTISRLERGDHRFSPQLTVIAKILVALGWDRDPKHIDQIISTDILGPLLALGGDE